MTRISKKAALAATGILGAGFAGGITYAAVSAPAGAASQPAPTAHPAAGHGRLGALGGRGGLRARRGILGRLEHGQLTLRVKNGDRTVDLQRGIVAAVSPTSISVTSLDKFPGVYTVDSATKVRTRAGLVSFSSVHKGDHVLVVASAGKAFRILDRP
jgi:hypothetical protein